MTANTAPLDPLRTTWNLHPIAGLEPRQPRALERAHVDADIRAPSFRRDQADSSPAVLFSALLRMPLAYEVGGRTTSDAATAPTPRRPAP